MSLALLKTLLYRKALEKRQHSSTASSCTGMEAAEVVTCEIPLLEMPFDDDDRTCRICCNEGHVPLSRELHHKTLAHHINLCSEITVSLTDGFPKYLCRSCFRLLKSAVKFRKLARSSTAKLVSMKMAQNAVTPSVERAGLSVKCEVTETADVDRTYEDGCPSPSPFAPQPVVQGGGVVPSCRTCGEDFGDIIEYRDHLSTCNETLLKDSSVSQADALINRKRRRKVPKGPFLCDVCGKELGKLHSLAVHMTTHRNVFPFKCDRCPYRGRTKDLLKVHLRTHLAVRPLACPKCPLRFITASNLSKHKLRHEQQTPQECPHCGKMFGSKVSVARHVSDMHTGTAPVFCEVCGKRFTRQKNLHKHRLKAHNIKSERTGRWPAYLLCQPEDSDACQRMPEQ